MAGDWIKVEHATPDKPEVVQLAELLRIDQDAAFGKCIRFWIWADQQSVDGNALGVTQSFLDRLTNCPGFAAGLIEVGWLTSRNGRFSVPNFDRQNGQTAKQRALTKDRVKRKRNDASVTSALPEKRREEKSKGVNPLKPPRAETDLPLLEPDAKLQAGMIPIPQALDTPAFNKAWEAWVRHLRTLLAGRVSQDGLTRSLVALVEKGPEKAVAMIDTAIANQWRSLQETKEERRGRFQGAGVNYEPGRELDPL